MARKTKSKTVNALADLGTLVDGNTQAKIDVQHKRTHFNDKGAQPSEPNAPYGLQSADERNLTQGTVFDAIQDIDDSSCKAQAWNALVYRNGFALVMGCFKLLQKAKFNTRLVDMEDDTDNTVNAVRRSAKLFAYASDEALTYATTSFEHPQAIGDILASAIKQQARRPKGLSVEERDALGLTEAEAKAAEAQAMRAAEAKAKKIGEDLAEHRHEVIALVQNLLDNAADAVSAPEGFSADQHDAMYQAVAEGLDRQRARTISNGLQFDGTFRDQLMSNARELNTARKVIEKHRAAFRRANLNELRHAA